MSFSWWSKIIRFFRFPCQSSIYSIAPWRSISHFSARAYCSCWNAIFLHKANAATGNLLHFSWFDGVQQICLHYSITHSATKYFPRFMCTSQMTCSSYLAPTYSKFSLLCYEYYDLSALYAADDFYMHNKSTSSANKLCIYIKSEELLISRYSCRRRPRVANSVPKTRMPWLMV